jgi:hypothetical protein
MESTTCFTNVGDVSWNWAVNIEKEKKKYVRHVCECLQFDVRIRKKKS